MIKNIQNKIEYLKILGMDFFKLTQQVSLEKILIISDNCEHEKIIQLLSSNLDKNIFFLKRLNTQELITIINHVKTEDLIFTLVPIKKIYFFS
jgi:hypothetical protein